MNSGHGKSQTWALFGGTKSDKSKSVNIFHEGYDRRFLML